MTTSQQRPTGRHASTSAVPPIASYPPGYQLPYPVQPPPHTAMGPVPPQWSPTASYPPPGMPPMPPAELPPPKKRGVGLGLSALITAVVGLPFGLFGTPIGFLLGIVAIGLAIAGFARGSGRVLAVIGGVVGVVVAIASLAIPSGGSTSTPASTSLPAPTVSTAPTTPVVEAPATTAPPAPPAPARAITAREWQKIAKDPSAHTGESIIVFGAVTQFDSATGTDSFRANVDGVRHQNEYEYETNTFLTGQAPTLSDVVNGDTFKAEVVVGEPYTYTTTMGGQMTVPTLVVSKITPVK